MEAVLVVTSAQQLALSASYYSQWLQQQACTHKIMVFSELVFGMKSSGL
jgi:hypothetical protein